MLSITALGALVINGSGVALDIDIDIELTVPGLDIDVSARVLLNTTGATQEIAVPARILDFLEDISAAAGPTAHLADDLLERLVNCSFDSTKRCYAIDHRAPNILVSSTLSNLLHNPSG